MTAEQFKSRCDALERSKKEADEEIRYMRDRVQIPPMDQLRPAVEDDIVVGAILYYPKRATPFWTIVSEVHLPIKYLSIAYTGEDGSWNRLNGAFVRHEVLQPAALCTSPNGRTDGCCKFVKHDKGRIVCAFCGREFGEHTH